MEYSGEVTDIDAQRGYVRVKIPDLDGIVTEWIPFTRACTVGVTQSVPMAVGTQVLVCRTFGQRWFCHTATPNDVDKPYNGASATKWGMLFPDGTKLEYDFSTHKLIAKGTLLAVDITALDVSITAPTISLNGAVTIDGALVAGAGLSVSGGDLNVDGGDIKAGLVSLIHHHHGGVSVGTGITSMPL